MSFATWCSDLAQNYIKKKNVNVILSKIFQQLEVYTKGIPRNIGLYDIFSEPSHLSTSISSDV